MRRLAPPLWFCVPYILATALPMVIASNLGVAREPRTHDTNSTTR